MCEATSGAPWSSRSRMAHQDDADACPPLRQCAPVRASRAAGGLDPASGTSRRVALAAGPDSSLLIEARCRVVTAITCRSLPLSSFASIMPRFRSATTARANLPDGACLLSSGRNAGDPCDLVAPGAMFQFCQPSSHSERTRISGTRAACRLRAKGNAARVARRSLRVRILVARMWPYLIF